MRWLFGSLIHLALRLISSGMAAAGGAALVATVFVVEAPSPEFAGWFAPVRQTALSLGFAFLAAAIAAIVLLPARRELIRPEISSEPSVPAAVLLLLAALALYSLWQTFALVEWWEENWALAEQMIPVRHDPSGLWIIPVTFVVAPPFLATLTVLLFVLTSMGAIGATPRLIRRLLWGCVLLQAGLVVGCSLALPPVRSLADRIVSVIASGPDAAVTASARALLERQYSFASSLVTRFQWILGGYALAALLLQSQGGTVDRVVSAEPQTPAPPAAATRQAPS